MPNKKTLFADNQKARNRELAGKKQKNRKHTITILKKATFSDLRLS